jgi:hypothetical protein
MGAGDAIVRSRHKYTAFVVAGVVSVYIRDIVQVFSQAVIDVYCAVIFIAIF